jgi:Zn-dependent protease with chaperone function
MDYGPDSGKKGGGLNLLHQQIDAYAFNAEWGPEMVGGTILLSLPELRFEFTDGHVVIPAGRLRAEVRPGDEERIAFTDLERPGLEIFTAEMGLLECTALPQLVQARAELVARLSKRDLVRRARILGYCVGACVLLAILASMILGYMVRVIAKQVPAEWDNKFKVETFEEFGIDETSTADSNLVAQIEALAAPLLAVVPPAPNGYKFYIVPESEPSQANAFALPGGQIVIFPALLATVEKPEDLLGVLAHEIAHVTERHQYREVISAAGPMFICESFFARSGGMGGLLGIGAALMIGAGFSQEHEMEADDVGWNYLVKAKIDPRGMIRVFEKFREMEAGSVDGLQAFSTHPATEKRIKRLQRRLTKLGPESNFIELPPLPKVTLQPSVKIVRPDSDPDE